MNSSVQTPWIDEGYKVFSLKGPDGLKVERLAKAVGKNKSSFYHHFADLEVFTELLLEHHLHQAEIMGNKEARCESLEELSQIFTEHKTDLLFSRQLRIHRDVPAFEACFCKTNEITLPNFIPLWSQIIGLEQNKHLAGLVLKLTIENFFLQITEETITPEWLQQYMRGMRDMVNQFDKTHSQ